MKIQADLSYEIIQIKTPDRFDGLKTVVAELPCLSKFYSKREDDSEDSENNHFDQQSKIKSDTEIDPDQLTLTEEHSHDENDNFDDALDSFEIISHPDEDA